MADDIGVSRYQAKAYIDSYLSNYSGVRSYMKHVVEDARSIGYTKTIYGRRRYIPELKSSNFNVRQGAERIALNTPIQGSAADLIKLAMIHVDKALRDSYPEARLILQVHDELLIETAVGEEECVAMLLAEEMKAAAAPDPLMATDDIGDLPGDDELDLDNLL